MRKKEAMLEEVTNQLPAIFEEETGNNLETAISNSFGKERRYRNPTEQAETNSEENVLLGVEMGGAKISP